MATHTDPAAPSIASLRVKERKGDMVVLSIPGTEYELHLAAKGAVAAQPGKRVKGEIHARALRMHRSDTGGTFIEPVYGTPRIVQGRIIGIDASHSRVLLDLTVPAWLTLHKDNTIDQFREGEMWNCYVESGTSFEAV